MKKNLLLVFGGRSGEHEVSLRSAKNVYNAIDRDEFNVFLLAIGKDGTFRYAGKNLVGVDDFARLINKGKRCTVSFEDGRPRLLVFEKQRVKYVTRLDLAFPVLHGTFGEDGTIQGLFEMANLPYVGGGVLASSLCMDKEICKRILRDHCIDIVPFYTIKKYAGKKEQRDILEASIKSLFPLFVKPANSGSSVGISKAKDYRALIKAVKLAFKYDNKIIVEKSISGREIECAVLGNDKPIAAVLGEVVPINEFYDYEAKYIKDGSKTIVPAPIDNATAKKIKEIAIKAYKACELEGMARVDFFLTKKEVFVNEINTIPGFTEISMFPMMWAADGLDYKRLIKRLIDLAFSRDRMRSKLLRSY